MAVFHNGKQIYGLYHNGKKINALYHNGKKIYQWYLPSKTDMFVTPTIVTGSRYYYTNEVVEMDAGSEGGKFNLNIFVNTTIELYHPISQTKNGIIISFKNYMAAVQTNITPENATWGYDLNGDLSIALSKKAPTGSATGGANIEGEGGSYELGATIIDDTHIKLWSRSESGYDDAGTSIALGNYSEFFAIIDSIQVA